MTIKQISDTVFRDSDGKIVLWQFPNIPLIGWMVCIVVEYVFPNNVYKSGFEGIGTALLFVWAYLEITQGVTYFRRLLGVMVLGVIVVGYFM